jgi:hypothetical protein
MTLKPLALAMVMAGSFAPAVVAQNLQTTLVTPQVAAPRPEGHATDTTDHRGLVNTPTAAIKAPTPKNAPGWHIPLPHIHHGR